MRNVILALNQRPVTYYPAYRHLTGTVACAVLLSQLMYWFSATGRTEVYKTDAEIKRETALTDKELRNAKKRLKDVATDYLKIELKRMPAVTHYSIDLDVFAQRLGDVGVASDLPTEKTSRAGNDNSKASENEAAQVVSEVVQYLNEKAGRRFEHTGKAGQANARIVKARLKEGVSIEQMKKVIDYKVAEWGGDYEMKKYLRPSTLFRPSHFYEYLEAAETVGSKTEPDFDVEMPAKIRALYVAAFERFRAQYPNTFAEVGFMSASEFLKFTSNEPEWFPMIKSYYTQSYRQQVCRDIFAGLEKMPNRRKVVHDAGGLFQYATRMLTENAIMA